MALIVCTPGGSGDNCYTSLVSANAIFANTLRARRWVKHSDTLREQALIQATGEIEDLGGPQPHDHSPQRTFFAGAPYATYSYDSDTGTYSQAQTLHFPRGGDVGPSGSTYIPPAIEQAVAEQAYWLLAREDDPPLVDRAGLQAEGVRSMSADGMSESYRPTGRPFNISPKAWDMVRPFVRHGAPTKVR